MRLLDLYELKVKEFSDNNRPPFVILSHTWGDGEVSFQDIHTPQAVTMAGYKKIQKFCEVAKTNGFQYGWIDTCCIDKTSSSELSEAINSMFNWYRIADVCYVFLADVGSTKPESEGHWPQFSSSLWFRRGWTLQELLAPEVLAFYNKNWTNIGTKRTLRNIISETTNIPPAALIDADLIRKYNVAERMSWASKRQTTRIEDIAYCLMGVFNVNMPPLYGEGDKAFMRLQYEIMKDSADQSILAWSWYSYRGDHEGDFGDDDVSRGVRLLARSPSDFSRSKGVVYKASSRCTTGSRPFSMTNQGLHIWLPCSHQIGEPRDRKWAVFLAELNCAVGNGENIKIVLQRDVTGSGRSVRGAWTAQDLFMDTWTNDRQETELFIAPFPEITAVFKSRYISRSSSRFQFVENPSPKLGYRIKFFYDGNAVQQLQEHSSPEVVFDCQTKPTNIFAHIIYLVVESIKTPSIQAVIALGNFQGMTSPKTRYYFRVFPGPDIPPYLAELTRLTRLNNTRGALELTRQYFSKIFLGPGDKELLYFPEDEMVENLDENYIITFAARAGPTSLTSNSESKVLSHTYRVHISLYDANHEDGVDTASPM